MPKASEIAQELRRIADSLEREPETELCRPMLSFYPTEKDHFLSCARLLPHPLKKVVGERDYEIEADSESLVWYRATIERQKVCALITPAVAAVYDCSPLLSVEEENSLTSEAANV